MLAALLCGLGLPTPRAREPLFASTDGAVQRESRGKNGGAAAEVEVEWCYTNTEKNDCDKSYYNREVNRLDVGMVNVPTRCSWVWVPGKEPGQSGMKCRPSSDEWVNWCYENDQSTCADSYFVTEAGVPKRCAWVEGLSTCRPAAELRIPLVAGWNRISWNVELDAKLLSWGQDRALLDAVVELRDVDGPISGAIAGHPSETWDLQDLRKGYKLEMASGPHELVLSGPPVDVCTALIPLNGGGGDTWIPYLLQDEEAPISGTVSPLRRTEGGWAQGDTIKDETSGTFTTYYTDYGWYGTLTTLRAGRMYVVTSAVPRPGSVTYAVEGECV